MIKNYISATNSQTKKRKPLSVCKENVRTMFHKMQEQATHGKSDKYIKDIILFKYFFISWEFG